MLGLRCARWRAAPGSSPEQGHPLVTRPDLDRTGGARRPHPRARARETDGSPARTFREFSHWAATATSTAEQSSLPRKAHASRRGRPCFDASEPSSHVSCPPQRGALCGDWGPAGLSSPAGRPLSFPSPRKADVTGVPAHPDSNLLRLSFYALLTRLAHSALWRGIALPLAKADSLRTAAVKIGDLVRYRRRLYWLRGFTPMSVSNRQAELQNVQTGEWITAPVDHVKPTKADDSDKP